MRGLIKKILKESVGGKYYLNEGSNTFDTKDIKDLDYKVLEDFWLKYKTLPKYTTLRTVFGKTRITDVSKKYPNNISLGTWIQKLEKNKFNQIYLKLLDEYDLFEENELDVVGSKRFVVTNNKGKNILLRSLGEVYAFNTLKKYGLLDDLEIDSRIFYNDCDEIQKEVDFVLPNKKIAFEIAGMGGERYRNRLELAKKCFEEKGWIYDYIFTRNKSPKQIHDEVLRVLNMSSDDYNNDDIITTKSLNKSKVKEFLTDELLKEISVGRTESGTKRMLRYLNILYGDNMGIGEFKNLHRNKIKNFLNNDLSDKESDFLILPYLELISQKYSCKKCGKYKSEPRANLCDICSRYEKRKPRPSCEELLNPNINKSAMSRKWDVSDTSIRKWITQCQNN